MIELTTEVETVGHLRCHAAEVWKTVCFYEHVDARPSWLLRTILPVPVRTTGCYGRVGDESLCLYSDGGYLAKRIVAVVEGKRIDFDIIEQSIRFHEQVELCGGSIRVVEHDDRSCAVHMITRYRMRSPLVAMIRFIVVATISAMHRFVMRDMLQRLDADAIKFVRQNAARQTLGKQQAGNPAVGVATD